MIMPTKGITALWASYSSTGPISLIPFPFPHCEKLTLFCNLNFTEEYINFEKYVNIYMNFMSNLFIEIYSGGEGAGSS
jgi:hypothetical protein